MNYCLQTGNVGRGLNRNTLLSGSPEWGTLGDQKCCDEGDNPAAAALKGRPTSPFPRRQP